MGNSYDGYGGWRGGSYFLFCLAIVFLIISLFFLFFANDDKKHRRGRGRGRKHDEYDGHSDSSDGKDCGKDDKKERNAFLAMFVLVWAVALAVLAVAAGYYHKMQYHQTAHGKSMQT